MDWIMAQVLLKDTLGGIERRYLDDTHLSYVQYAVNTDVAEINLTFAVDKSHLAQGIEPTKTDLSFLVGTCTTGLCTLLHLTETPENEGNELADGEQYVSGGELDGYHALLFVKNGRLFFSLEIDSFSSEGYVYFDFGLATKRRTRAIKRGVSNFMVKDFLPVFTENEEEYCYSCGFGTDVEFYESELELEDECYDFLERGGEMTTGNGETLWNGNGDSKALFP